MQGVTSTYESSYQEEYVEMSFKTKVKYTQQEHFTSVSEISFSAVTVRIWSDSSGGNEHLQNLDGKLINPVSYKQKFRHFLLFIWQQ